MAGGRGKRLKPLTNDTPKPLLKVNGRPMLEWIIKRFVDQGFKDIYISIGYLGDSIKRYFRDGKDFGCSIQYINETVPLGTAGALRLLPKQTEDLIVINGDILSSVNYTDLVRYHKNKGAIATVGATTHKVDVPFGVLSIKDYYLVEMDEKPTFNFPIAAGIYVISPQALRGFPKGYLDMPEFIESLSKVAVFPISGDWHDVGRHEDLALVNELSA